MSQKKDKLLKYKCKGNVCQEHNSDILCYKFIFNQNINSQMSQKKDKLLKYKCKGNVCQEHNSDILCYKFIFNQNINS